MAVYRHSARALTFPEMRKANRQDRRPIRLYGCLSLPLLIWTLAPYALGADLIVKTPEQSHISVATAIERDSAVNVAGTIHGDEAKFSNLQSDTPYDLAIELTDGRLLCGADMSWCDPTPADPQAEPLGDDDKQQIDAIVTQILGFADKPKLAMLVGSHDRAVGLVDLTRTKGFHSDKGGEVIWREEVWFFKWENGGWERVADQSRLLRRERFPTKAAYEKEMSRVRWVPALGGVQLPAGSRLVTVMLGAKDIAGDNPESTAGRASPPTTRASGSPGDSPTRSTPASPPPP
jgi:hypothetical protein